MDNWLHGSGLSLKTREILLDFNSNFVQKQYILEKNKPFTVDLAKTIYFLTAPNPQWKSLLFWDFFPTWIGINIQYLDICTNTIVYYTIKKDGYNVLILNILRLVWKLNSDKQIATNKRFFLLKTDNFLLFSGFFSP